MLTSLEEEVAQWTLREGSIWIPFCGCWLYEGCLTDGYGCIYFQGSNYRAHRLSYLAFRGPIPEDLCVCHDCDTPSCINPNHLFLGTRGDNARDAVRKGRNVKGVRHGMYGRTGLPGSHVSKNVGENHPLSRLKEEQVREIFRLREGGWKQKELAIHFGINAEYVGQILRGQKWKYLYTELCL